MRRATTVLLSTVLVTGGLAVTAPPAGAADIVTRDLTITVTGLGPENRTCEIDADLYVPAGVNKHTRAPALLATNGFGGTKEDQADLAQGFGEHGYVTLSYTGLGFVDGDTCPITLDDREHDGEAASQLLRFLGGDRSVEAVDDATGKKVVVDQVIRQDRETGTRNDPAVGMTGGSYGGQIQFAAAAVEHAAGTDRLDAIIPLITWNDLAYSLAPENSALPGGTANGGPVSSSRTGVFKYQWAALFSTVGVVNGVEDMQALADPETWNAFVTANCGNFDPPVCQALAEVGTQGYPSQDSIEFLHSNSVASYMSDVQVPTLIGQGQADTLFNLQESVATYASLKAQGTPVSLVWQSWGHSDSTPVAGELDMRHPADSYQGRQAIAWFEHYVRGTGPAPELNFSYYRDWVFEQTGDVEQAYTSAPAFPVGTEQTLYLSSEGAGRRFAGQRPLGRRLRHQRLRQYGPRRAELHRDLGPRPVTAGLRPAGQHGPVRDGAADRACRRGGVAAVDRDAELHRRGHAGARSGRRTRRVREALRHRARRHADRTAAPADLPRADRGRDPAGHDRAAGHRAPLRDGAPAGRRPRRRRPGLSRVDPSAGRHPQHRPGDRAGAHAPRRDLIRQAPAGAPTCSRTQSTISVVVAPGVKIFATPIRSSSGMSSSGMMPPPKTTTSSTPRSRISSDSRANRVMCAPERTDSPTASASSCTTVSTICSGVWCRPV